MKIQTTERIFIFNIFYMSDIIDSKFIRAVIERLKVSPDYSIDQFLAAAAMKNNLVRDIVTLMSLNKINPNYWMLGVVIRKDNVYKIGLVHEMFKNPIINFIELYKGFRTNHHKNVIIRINIDRCFHLLRILGLHNNQIEAIERFYLRQCLKYSLYDNIISDAMNKNDYKKTIKYKIPKNRYESNECLICMNEKMRYVWLSCGHNLCKDCFEKISKNKRHIRCPYCNQEVKL